jgi:predicted amidohydrolase
MKKDSVKVGIIQAGPFFLDVDKRMEQAVTLIEEAVEKGAELLVFGETWLSGYPAWIDLCPEVAYWDHEPAKEAFLQLYNSGIRVPGKETRTLGELARKHNIVISIGVNEVVDSGVGGGTIYNALLLIDASGEVVVHHRKLMPTYTEKLLYGAGDGHGLKTVDTHLGRVGGLICWEHWMPLARQAMHIGNEHIHVAVWPTVHEIHQLASRQYAFEGRCFVVAAGQILRAKDIPQQLKLPPHLENKPEELVLKGGSCIIGPDGKFLLEPQMDKEGIFVYEITGLDRVYKERMTLDTSGHYNREDVFNFTINHKRPGGLF